MALTTISHADLVASQRTTRARSNRRSIGSIVKAHKLVSAIYASAAIAAIAISFNLGAITPHHVTSRFDFGITTATFPNVVTTSTNLSTSDGLIGALGSN